ncbi:YbaL family putative K(+) efflux transporter [Aestuariivirga sp.]|jgi:CPA2 family monovalent cation:H+ antiporter-2|uniref:YbaL family putative K(+) efflux transporter n=1 Tax=Aestuariivirga sp. TaxID=2650926 RepID=UPI0037850178
MPHDTPLIATIAVGLGLAFLLGLAANRMRLPPIAGYLIAGVLIGPFTPGFVADQKMSQELAEIGVMLLMFGVGLHFSLKDLLSVRAIAIPGAIGQIAAATVLGMVLSATLGWSWGAGLVFGLSLSVASTVVLLKALQERRLVETERGKIAVGWLIVEDIFMVLTLVLLPPLAGFLGGREAAPGEPLGMAAALGLGTVWETLLFTALKIAVFVGLMLVVGRRIIPWLLHYVAHTGSRELFRLAVLAVALGVAYGSAALFGVSFALGAFFAGMVLAESPLSTQAAKDTLPLRDAFAVLFFVSVGMLFNPFVLVNQPLAVLGTFLIIVAGKSGAAYLIVRLFRHSRHVALTISASLAQIGEFSFILVVLGTSLQILPPEARDLVVAGAILSILVNPLLFFGLDKWTQRQERVEDAAAAEPGEPAAPAEPGEAPTKRSGHVIVVGHGQVGSSVAAGLKRAGSSFLVVESDSGRAAAVREQGMECFSGASGEPELLRQLNIEGAKVLVSTLPDPFEAGHVIEHARAVNPAIRIIARATSTDSIAYLKSLGADLVFSGQEEIAQSMLTALAKESRDAEPQGQPGGTAA